MRRSLVVAVLLAAGCSQQPEPPRASSSTPAATSPATTAATAIATPSPIAPVTAAEPAIAWEKGDVDAAFARARSEHKPLFLYWGAVWCPPCNQVKATIFNRQDFIERSRFFIPVYLDGDDRNAQKQGARFKVGGYPTMILFTPEGTEITRLPGEVDAEEYMRVLDLGMNGARPVKATLAAALGRARGAAALTPEDWRMLAYYSWDTDEQTLVAPRDIAPTLRRLAAACPRDQQATAARLHLKAIAAAATAPGAKPRDEPADRGYVTRVLADLPTVQANFELMTDYAGEIAGHLTLPKSQARSDLVTLWDAMLRRLVERTKLSATDRLSVVAARVALAKLDAADAKVPDALLASVREEVARAEKQTKDPYAREVVINGGAYVLREAGLLDESDALLTAELTRSATPYYAMLGLAGNAKKRGDKAGAIAWAEKAYATASGPATRLQWGVSYVSTLVDLAPDDAARIEKAAGQVIGELEPVPETFYDRNRRSLERMARKLLAWNKGDAHATSIRQLRSELGSVCAKIPARDPARVTCERVWTAKAGAA